MIVQLIGPADQGRYLKPDVQYLYRIF